MSKNKFSNCNNHPDALTGLPLVIGLDIGYGVVKAVTPDATITFPSVMGHAREIKFRQDDITTKYPGDQLIDDEGAWFIGDLALTQLPPGELLRLRGQTANEATIGNMFRLRLTKAVIGKLLIGMKSGDIAHRNWFTRRSHARCVRIENGITWPTSDQN